MGITKQQILSICQKYSSEPYSLFEIGAADGNDTVEFINTFKDKNFHLYSFEPDSRNIVKFKAQVNSDKVTLIEKAISNEVVAQKEWYLSSTGKDGWVHTYSNSLREPFKHLEEWSHVPFEKSNTDVTTLDTFVEENKIEKLDFIWADVQGCEDLMILGGINSLNAKTKFLYTEYANIEYYKNQPTLNQILELLPNFRVLIDYKTDVLLVNKTLVKI